MDIIDVILGRAHSSAAQISSLVAQAQAALNAAQESAGIAEDAATTASGVAENLTQIQSDITTAATNIVDNRLSTVNTTIENIQTAITNLQTSNGTKSTVSLTTNNTATQNTTTISVTNGENTASYSFINYTNATGSNTDGSMTQAAIKAYVESVKEALETEIANNSSSGGGDCSCQWDEADANKILIVNSNGRPTPSTITIDDVLAAEVAAGTYHPLNAIGLEIDYVNNSVNVIDTLEDTDTTKNLGLRCNAFNRARVYLNDSGEEDVAGQVMVRQPAFYYRRAIINSHYSSDSDLPIIDKEILLVSDTPQVGFELHPAFTNVAQYYDNIPVIYLGAYESCIQNSDDSYVINDETVPEYRPRLASQPNVLPLSGINHNISLSSCTTMAERRGLYWGLTDIEVESLQQLLMIIEFKSVNLQTAWNLGPTFITPNSTSQNLLLYTGSTATLGNASGQASSSHTSQASFSEEGRCAISYRGFENPYGNAWRYVSGVTCDNTNSRVYQLNIGNELITTLPSTSGWISGFGYSDKAPYAFIVTNAGRTASSAVPVGDYYFCPAGASQAATYQTICIIGGHSTGERQAGPFNYAYDMLDGTTLAYKSNPRLLYRRRMIPD